MALKLAQHRFQLTPDESLQEEAAQQRDSMHGSHRPDPDGTRSNTAGEDEDPTLKREEDDEIFEGDGMWQCEVSTRALFRLQHSPVHFH